MTKTIAPISAPTTIKQVTFKDQAISFYAPRWFRRQNKGRTFRAFARELHAKLVTDYVQANTVAAQPA